jgi:hypothetical protein
MPEGYEGASQRDSRLGEQDQARRRGGASEGLSASRESGRGRQSDREGLGPVRRRRGGGSGGPGRGRGRGRGGAPSGGDRVEQPRTDETGTSAEGREQPVIEPQVETVDAPVVDAPDTTTPKTMHEDPTKLDQSGDPSQEKTD